MSRLTLFHVPLQPFSVKGSFKYTVWYITFLFWSYFFIYLWYHLFRRCFRCRVCGLQLSLRTFHFDQENDPDVYCKNHVPKFVGTIDGEALNVRTALNAPKVTKTKEVKGQIISKKEVFKLMRSYLIYLWKVCSLLVHWRNKL